MESLINYKNLVDYSLRKISEDSDKYNCYKSVLIQDLEFGHHMTATVNDTCNTGLINDLKYQLSDPSFENSWAIHFNDFAKIVIYQDYIEVDSVVFEKKNKSKRKTFKDIDQAITYFNSIKS